MATGKKSKQLEQAKEPFIRGPEVLVPMMCYCTWKVYPHFHKRDHPIDAPWNWEETNMFWDMEKIKPIKKS